MLLKTKYYSLRIFFIFFFLNFKFQQCNIVFFVFLYNFAPNLKGSPSNLGNKNCIFHDNTTSFVVFED